MTRARLRKEAWQFLLALWYAGDLLWGAEAVHEGHRWKALFWFTGFAAPLVRLQQLPHNAKEK